MKAWKQLIGYAVLALSLASGRLAFGQYEGLVINEILPSPTNASGVYVDANQDGAASSIDDEFIELLNTSAAGIDVAGMWITDANTGIRRHVFGSRVLPPGGALVVFGGGSLLNFSNPPAQIATGGGLSLNNDNETVSLYSPQTTLVDQVSYQLTASHNAISLVRNPDGSGGFTNHYVVTTNAARASPGRRVHGQPFLTRRPPVLLDLPDQTAFVGLELQFPVRAYDPADRDAITLSLLDNPANSTLSSTGGVGTFRFTAAPEQAGQVYPVAFVAGDGDGAETNEISIHVINPNAAEDVWINELHYDNDGIDANEGVEIAGNNGSVLTNYALVFYDGNNGKVDGATNWLTGTLDDEQCGYGAAWFAHVGIENETEGIALVKGSNVVQFLSYEGVFTASNGPAVGMTSVDIGVRETAVTVGYSLQLTGTGTSYSAFAWTNARPHSRATLNAGQAIECLSPAAIEIHKTVYLGHDGGASAPGVENVQGTNGAAITYAFVVVNTGGRAITNAEIQDISLGIPPIALGTLATGSVSTAYVETVISGDLRNTATVTGSDPDGAPVADEDTAEVVEIIPSIDIQLTVYRGQDGGASCPGSGFLQATNETPVTFCFVVENNGNTNVNSLVISNATLGIGPISIGTLPAGGSFVTSVASVVTSSLTHVATVSGTDPNGDPIGDQDSATVEIIHPALQLQKTVYLGHDGGASCPGTDRVAGTNGAAITYCFLISNSGDATLTNAVLDDAGVPGFSPTHLGTLATGAFASVFFESILLANHVNSATVTAFTAIGTLVEAEDSAEVVEISPGLDIQLTVYRGQDSGAACPGSDFLQATNGNPVTFCLVVENTGDTPLTSLVIVAESLGIGPIPVGALEADGLFATSVAAVVTSSLTHVATVSGTDPNGDTIGDQDSATVEIIHPALQLQKTVYLGHDGGLSCPGSELATDTNGAPITFCFQLSNIGDVPLVQVVLEDAGLSGFSATNLGTLATGETASLFFESILLADRVNTATATAFSVIGTLVQAEDSAAVAFAAPPDPPGGGGEFEVVDLGTLGGDSSGALAINDRSQVVGWAVDDQGRTQAFLWQGGGMTGLGFLPGEFYSLANAINNNGDIVGFAYVGPTAQHAFLYRSNSLADLGTLGGPRSLARAINDAGDIVGWSWLASNQPNNSDQETFVWRSNGFIHITPFHDYYSCEATGVNKSGRICGNTFLWATGARWWAYVWYDANGNGTNDNDEMQLLGNLGETYSWGSYSGANAINDSGQVVGWTCITNWNYPQHAFLVTPRNGQWKIPAGAPITSNSLMQSLGVLGGPTNNSWARDINNETWIVGTADMPAGTNQAFLWRYGAMENLNDLIATNSGWVLTEAAGINEHNEIVGSGLHHGQPRAFLLRQGGRITHVDKIVQTTNFWVYTNDFGDVVTQAVEEIQTHVLQWAGIWGTNANASHVFTVEYCDALQDHVWKPFYPTNQWPTGNNIWTNSDYGAVSMRFFRVRAK